MSEEINVQIVPAVAGYYVLGDETVLGRVPPKTAAAVPEIENLAVWL